MRLCVICNDPRINTTIKNAASANNLEYEILDHEEYFYPSAKHILYANGCGRFSQRGRYFDFFLRAMYRDMKFSWRYLDTDAEIWYLGIKNFFEPVLKKYDGVIFTNVPHEGLDLIIAELAEDLGMVWFAPLQCMNKNPAFQLFSNGLKKIRSARSIELRRPSSTKIGVRYEKENTRIVRVFQAKTKRPPIVDKILDRVHRIYRKVSTPEICEVVHKAENYGLLALHMQPELTTEPLTGSYANPVTWIETILKKFPNHHWVIKEHPDPSDRYRGKYLHSYITEGVQQKRFSYLHGKTKINLKDYKIISTLNGTIGIEALSLGIPVACHSSAFYSDAQGVYLLDVVSECNSDKICYNKEFKLNTNNLFLGLTDPYMKDQYGMVELEKGWNELFKIVVEKLNQ